MRRFHSLSVAVALVLVVSGLAIAPAVAETAVVDTTRVSVASDGTEANDSSYSLAISADGSTIAYRSSASNLVADDTNGWTGVFVHDVATATTTRVSVASDGTLPHRHIRLTPDPDSQHICG